MIPIKDDIPTRRTPIVTYLLVAANVAVFTWQIGGAPSFEASVLRLGLVPAEFWRRDTLLSALVSVFTSMFAHGSFLHVASNLLYLWIFANNVEDVMGRARFAVFYLLCGIGAVAAQVIAAPTSTIPMVGASGAISGMLGAYLLLFPFARVLVVVPIFFFIRLAWLPAALFILLWLVLQILGGLLSDPARGGVAFWAHVGGAFTGMVFLRFFLPTDIRRIRRRTRYLDYF
ncbi:MAG: rhomboid family intramembrane serine protease [Pseudomonadota bacterium]|nr:MAG: rhomboid family intramembrane serine protease [Pseudomonadota bacterium]